MSRRNMLVKQLDDYAVVQTKSVPTIQNQTSEVSKNSSYNRGNDSKIYNIFRFFVLPFRNNFVSL